MNTIRFFLLLAIVAPLVAAKAPNVLLICIDDLRPDLACYGADYMQTPHIDKLASEGRSFKRHYVQAPTCGASRYALLTGIYGPANNHALFSRAKNAGNKPESVSPSLPSWFRTHGYQTVSIGKVSHQPGGFGGPDWNDETQLEMPFAWDRSSMPTGPWQHPRGAMHGLANGEIRSSDGTMDVYQSFDGPDTSYPDGLITESALEELTTLANETTPFFLAVGFIKPHLPFGAPAKYLECYSEAEFPVIPHPDKPESRTTWHSSREFMKYNRLNLDPNTSPAFALEVRRHYAACVSYADEQVGILLAKLEELDLDKNTIVILWGDHGWHLGEHAVWGKHTLFEESLRSPLIIRTPDTPQPGMMTEGIVETVDLYPTLCELAQLPIPDFLNGTSLTPLISNPATPGRNAISYYGSAITIRTETHRLIVHKDGYTELYSHESANGETINIAEKEPKLVEQLIKLIQKRAPEKLPNA